MGRSRQPWLAGAITALPDIVSRSPVRSRGSPSSRRRPAGWSARSCIVIDRAICNDAGATSAATLSHRTRRGRW